MLVWVWDTTGRLVRVDFNTIKMTDQSNPPKVLMDFCYLPRSSNPSCIKLPSTSEDEFELKPSYIAMLPKFSGLDTDYAYLFIREFEEVCTMFKIN